MVEKPVSGRKRKRSEEEIQRRKFVTDQLPMLEVQNEEFRLHLSRYSMLRILWIKSRRLIAKGKKK